MQNKGGWAVYIVWHWNYILIRRFQNGFRNINNTTKTPKQSNILAILEILFYRQTILKRCLQNLKCLLFDKLKNVFKLLYNFSFCLLNHLEILNPYNHDTRDVFFHRNCFLLGIKHFTVRQTMSYSKTNVKFYTWLAISIV